MKNYRLRKWLKIAFVYLNAFDKWRKEKMSAVNFLMLAALVVGLLGGIAGATFKAITHAIENYLQDLKWDYKYYLFLAFPLIGIALTVLYVHVFIRKSKFDHGISQILQSISKNNSKIPFHNIYSQIITSAITVGFGGSVGMEAPIAVSGSAIGSNTGSFFCLNYRDRTMLLACGAAAGIASVFNSPVAGMVFAIELLLPEFSIPAFIPLLISSAVAAVVSQLIFSEPLFVLISNGWQMEALIFYAALGIIAGCFGLYFTKLISIFNRLFAKIRRPYSKVWIGGICLGLMIAILPTLYGEGYTTIQKLLDKNYSVLVSSTFFQISSQDSTWIIIFGLLSLFGKSIACLITTAAGGNGGIFGPSLVMGGLIGFLFSFSLNYFLGLHLNITNFIVVGMAASLGGVMHAPLTGIFLIAEMTGGYRLMVPLMIACAISYYINRRVNRHSLYVKSLVDKGGTGDHNG